MGARVTASSTPTGHRRPVPAAHAAIIGGGLAGLACARRLTADGWTVTVFDKGRTPGGRIATRCQEGLQFDHGAQYFTARDPSFARQVENWQADGVVGLWAGRIATLGGPEPRDAPTPLRYVGTPAMNAIGRHLATGAGFRSRTRIASVRRDAGGWTLTAADGTAAGRFSHLVVAIPAPQALAFLDASAALRAAAAEARYAPCLTAMLGFARSLSADFDAAFCTHGTLGWVARDGAKPGRGGGETWVVHASADWSATHLEEPPEQIALALSAAFTAAIGMRGLEPGTVIGHRWRHALVTRAAGEPCFFDPVLSLGTCGDWCLGGRIEAAWLSGVAMAERLITETAEASS